MLNGDKEIVDSGMFDENVADNDEEIKSEESQNKNDSEESQEEDTEKVDTDTSEEDQSEDDQPEDDTDTTQRDDLTELFEKKGLLKQYPGGVRDLIEKTPDANRYITQVAQENADLRRLLLARENRPKPEAEKPGKPTAEEFYEDPVRHVEEMGFISKDEAERVASNVVESRLADERYEHFKESTADWDKYFPAMDQVFRDNPEMAAMPKDRVARLCYKLAKAEAPRQREEDDSPGDTDKATRANTSGGKARRKTSHAKSVEDFKGMSLDELEKEIGYG